MSQVLVPKIVRSRHVVVTWFGNCSYRRLKVTYEVRKTLCPLCKRELEEGRYFGDKVFETNLKARGYIRDGWSFLCEDGREVWVVSHKGGLG